MKKSILGSLMIFFIFNLLLAEPSFSNTYPAIASKQQNPDPPKIQAAILLDVSNSMDGLIEQAKAQLWKMMNTLGKTSCKGISPKIEIALYEYGRPANSEQKGFVRQISPFTTDLDLLSKKLFELTTDGGEEYCGRVIFSAIEELSWDKNPGSYKVIFIAGNEDFRQGNVLYSTACNRAKERGVIVNTIFCGERLTGINQHWNLGPECGSGSFTNINADADFREIPTPFDNQILALNEKLNGTYIAYGVNGKVSHQRQSRIDSLNKTMSASIAVDRALVKGTKELYNNSTWDVIDASEAEDDFLTRLEPKSLPGDLQHKTPGQLRDFVKQKSGERASIRADIEKLAVKRQAYIQQHKTKSRREETLESGIEKIIRQQAGRFNMIIR